MYPLKQHGTKNVIKCCLMQISETIRDPIIILNCWHVSRRNDCRLLYSQYIVLIVTSAGLLFICICVNVCKSKRNSRYVETAWERGLLAKRFSRTDTNNSITVDYIDNGRKTKALSVNKLYEFRYLKIKMKTNNVGTSVNNKRKVKALRIPI